MCSTTESRLAMIGTAIDELAEAVRAEAAAGPGTAGPVAAGPRAAGSGTAGPGTAHTRSDTMAERVAGIWAMVADLDPGLAQRLSQYTDPYTDPGPQPTTHD